jgi:hypothetical protein
MPCLPADRNLFCKRTGRISRGKEAPMIKFSGTILINCTPERVSDFVSDFENAPKWQGGVVHATKLDEGPIREGSRFQERVRIGLWRVDAACTVTAYTPAKEMTFTASSKPMDYTGSFTFTPESGGTRVTVDGSGRMKGFWKLFEPVVKMDAQQSVKKELNAIKVALESGPQTAVAARS